MPNLSDIVERKFVDTIDLSELGLELEIESDTGWVPLTHFNLTVPYDVWTVQLASGVTLECADTHILFRADMTEVFAKDLLAFDEIMTRSGPDAVLAVYKQECEPENMFDLTVDSDDHRYYCSAGILHHNTTIAAAILLWHILFHKSYTVAILANKADSAQEILERIQMAYESLPFWLQRGVTVWNKRRIVLDNKSKIFTAATSASGIRGKSCVAGDSLVTVRNKFSGVVETTTISEFISRIRPSKEVANYVSDQDTGEVYEWTGAHILDFDGMEDE